MKTTLIFALTALVTLSSCKKEDNSSNGGTPQALSISTGNTLSSGSWRVTYFFDNTDETAKFSGYTFNFAAGGTVTATKTGTTVTGTWSTGTDDSTPKLFLNFSTPANFNEISDDWHIIGRTDAKITLQDVSGGNGGTDYLTFEKN